MQVAIIGSAERSPTRRRRLPFVPWLSMPVNCAGYIRCYLYSRPLVLLAMSTQHGNGHKHGARRFCFAFGSPWASSSASNDVHCYSQSLPLLNESTVPTHSCTFYSLASMCHNAKRYLATLAVRPSSDQFLTIAVLFCKNKSNKDAHPHPPSGIILDLRQLARLQSSQRHVLIHGTLC